MSQDDTRIHIDSDWKSEAAQAKEHLAEQEARAVLSDQGAAPVQFLEIVNLLAMQAAIAMGGFQGPSGERIPPNPPAAKLYIDLLDVLEQKTRGNLADAEKTALESVLYELRMQFVGSVAPPVNPPPPGR